MPKSISSISKWRIVWFSIGLGVLYWIVDIFSDVFIFNEGTLSSQIFSPHPHEIWMRFLTMSVFVCIGVLAQQIITGNKKIEKLIRESDQKHSMVLNNIDEIVYFVKLPEEDSFEGTVQFVSERVERILGYRPEEFMQDQGLWFRLIHPDDIPVVVERTKDIFRNKQIDTRSYRLRHKSTDEYIWVEDRVAPQLDYSGKVTGIFGVVRDISERKQTEEALKESEEQYRLLFQYSPIGVFHYTNDLIVTECNTRFTEIVHLTPEQIRGFDLKMLKVESVQSALNTAIKGEKGFYEGLCLLSPVPGDVWVTLLTAPHFGRQGDIKGGIGIVEDITERKLAEQGTFQSLSLLKVTLESTTDGILAVNREGKITSFNQKFVEMWRIPQSIIDSRDDSQALSFVLSQLGDPEGFLGKVRELYAHPDLESFDTIEFKDGRTFERYSKPQKIGETSVGRVWSFRDITERKKLEERIFQINQDWEDTFNIITDMITVHDADFNIIRYNKAAEKMLGLSFLNIKKEKCYQFYHGTECPPAGCPSCMTFKTGVPATVEVFEPHLNMFIEIRAIPRFDSEHNLIGLIHVVRDITEHRKLENELRQSQKMEAVGQLAGGIAHDFNNIITAIIGYASIMKMKSGPDDDFRGLIDNVLSASEKAANLVRSLLAFSRKQESNPEPVRINDIIKSIEKLLLMAVGEGIKLKIELTPPASPPPLNLRGGEGELIVMADIVQIEQVMMNLCTNARDAMSGSGALTIKTGAGDLTKDFITAHGYGEEGRYALISVSDTGVGMDENTRERIFEPFFTTKEVGKGSGLGLSIVYGIIKQHKGYIICESEPGKGTTFNIYLPVVKAAMKELKRIETAVPAGAGRTILFAEDEEEFRKLMRQVLESSGYNVIEAVDGEDAVNKFTENNIDLLLFDIIMPKMSGKEAYEKIRKIRPGVKALFISGYPADFTSKYGVFEEGMNIISKPVQPSTLLRKIMEAFSNASGK